jgi:hypothetical protein
MGSRAWGSLSVLLLTSAALVGCNNPQKDTRTVKDFPPIGQAQQKAPLPFPNGQPQQQFNTTGNPGAGGQQKSFLPANQTGPSNFAPDPFKQPTPQSNQPNPFVKQTSGVTPPPNLKVFEQNTPTPPDIDFKLPPSSTTPSKFGDQREGVQMTVPPGGLGNSAIPARPDNFPK